MTTSELLFLGIRGSVVALHRATGEQAWITHLKGSDFVNVLVERGQVFATCYGEIFCLNALTGEGLWHNKLKGLGTGLVTIATEDSVRSTINTILSEKRRRDEAASQAAAT